MPDPDLVGGPVPDQEVAECAVEWQASLFGAGEPGFDPTMAGRRRIDLDATCWVDHLPRWLDGSDHVFAELVARLPWRQRTVPMYDRMVQEPRLVWWWAQPEGDAAVPLPVLDEVRHALSRLYQRSFDSIGCNYYRTGADSVAWHGDRMRHEQIDPLVAIVSVGAPRPFQLRPRGGGHALSFLLGQGDLLVMGGAIQHDWEHWVPKVAAAGPRISITYRHGAESPAALRAVQSRHPAAGAQNRHRAATGSTNAPGRLSASGADRRDGTAHPGQPESEGRPS
jgi:alkylated DNA repair dioxygenase AlkB